MAPSSETELTRPADRERHSVTRAAGIIALGDMAGRALGLARMIITANIFGATGLVSAYQVAATVVDMFYDLLIGGILNPVLVPVFSEYAALRTKEELWQFASVFLSLTAAVTALFIVALELLAPQVAWLLGSGLSTELQAVSTNAIRIVVPAILFWNLAGAITALLYTLRRFSYPALGVVALKVGPIVALLLLSGPLGIYSLVVGTVLGTILQLAVQLPGLRGTRLSFLPTLSHPGLRRIFLLYLPIVLGLAVTQVQVAIDRNLASHTGEQSIAWMKNADNLIQFPFALVAMAISRAVLPSLSQLSATADWGAYKHTLTRGLRLVVLLILPATVGLFVMAQPIIALLFEHGAFTPHDTLWTAKALRCYLLGLVFAAVDWPLNFAFYARQNTLTPALVGILSVGVYLGAALLLMGPLGMIGLALAASIKHAAHALAMLVLLHKRVGGLQGHQLGTTTLKALLASAVMGALTYGAMTGLQGLVSGDTLWRELAVVAGAGLIGLLSYGALVTLLGGDELRSLRRE